MIDLNQLTQEQRWGVDFATLEANKPIQTENEQINASNASAKQADKEPLKELFTSQSYLESVIRSACDSYYKQLVDFKKKSALQMFDSLTPEQQAALVAQLHIPDVLPE
jgi:Spy/CpxP family protein refolding chaperone